MTNIAQIDLNDKSIDGVLGIRTRGSRIIGADESAELWRHPREDNLFKWTIVLLMSFFIYKETPERFDPSWFDSLLTN